MTTIFVGNLPHAATESDVRSLFAKYGRVSSVRIKTDGATNKPRGFAFVTMPSMDDADEAIVRLSRASLGGRALTVNEARSRLDSGQTSNAQTSDLESSGERQSALQLFAALRKD